MPFRRDDAAFRFDLTEPRHAGQNDTRSILWVGHFGIAYLLNVDDFFLHSNVLGSSDAMGAIWLPLSEPRKLIMVLE
jgi:hypothetical protein